jgi:hypothetical protein
MHLMEWESLLEGKEHMLNLRLTLDLKHLSRLALDSTLWHPAVTLERCLLAENLVIKSLHFLLLWGLSHALASLLPCRPVKESILNIDSTVICAQLLLNHISHLQCRQLHWVCVTNLLLYRG